MKKLNIKSDNCLIDNKSYGTFVNGENLTDIIKNQLPKMDEDCPAKISIEIEIFDKKLECSTGGYEVEKEGAEEGE